MGHGKNELGRSERVDLEGVISHGQETMSKTNERRLEIAQEETCDSSRKCA
jgi:hypothetical protein